MRGEHTCSSQEAVSEWMQYYHQDAELSKLTAERKKLFLNLLVLEQRVPQQLLLCPGWEVSLTLLGFLSRHCFDSGEWKAHEALGSFHDPPQCFPTLSSVRMPSVVQKEKMTTVWEEDGPCWVSLRGKDADEPWSTRVRVCRVQEMASAVDTKKAEYADMLPPYRRWVWVCCYRSL